MDNLLTLLRYGLFLSLFYSTTSMADQVIILRHALAPGVGDPEGFDLAECQTQRVLSSEGHQQALEIGQKLRKSGINEAEVFSSEWCRCLETAELLGFGPPQKLKALNSFFHVSNRHLKQQFLQDWKAHISEAKTIKTKVYITHQVNISGLLDKFVLSGEGVVVEVNEQGQLKIVSVLQ
ncbi:histidine phosphatase family protein [Methylophaga nitratireducenticrescens]|uniref:Phosphoglycerate mutase-like protein n=1 Tax=Methylophaga nitratireducenticrescens TaxID=754476 RepID=I1XI30_METNJ|nr:histidine phosphatase family protein [Methylophaga nitratireducenticrescens]AFI84049.1 histidine phosphatase family protein [Methylophaga nitratireducenticrescens]AUZ84130.1 histidine phosphatase family protein [Methylophaga nitratireducenticrescens]